MLQKRCLAGATCYLLSPVVSLLQPVLAGVDASRVIPGHVREVLKQREGGGISVSAPFTHMACPDMAAQPMFRPGLLFCSSRAT